MITECMLPDHGLVRFRVAAPEIRGEVLPRPVFRGDTAQVNGIELRRHLRKLPDGFAISLELVNLRDRPIDLNRWALFIVEPGDGTFPHADELAAWRVFVMARQKNNACGYFQPTVADEAMNDVTHDTSEAVAGDGITQASGGRAELPCRFSADPGMVIEVSVPGAQPILLAFCGQDRHLNEVVLETTPDRSTLRGLEAAALYDGMRIEPGTSVQTHELLLRTGPATHVLLARYTEDVASLYGVPRPSRQRPTVYCTWYFYGEDFTADDLEEDLNELRRRPIPCDIFQVDNGWMDIYGDWRANNRFPAGLEAMAKTIRRAGYMPGIWTAPFVLQPDAAVLKSYPDLPMRTADGKLCLFRCSRGNCLILDPFAPHAEAYIHELFTRLRAAGFRYHKLDYVRSLILHAKARYYRADQNRAQAYRHALRLIRGAVGSESLIEVCGGLYEGSAGLADIVRSSRDVQGRWRRPGTRASNYDIRIRQNISRNHYNRLWISDPDALQLRRRSAPFPGNADRPDLSLGTFTDEEAFTLLVNTFLGGGLTCFSERMAEFDEDRRLLLRHVIPQYAPAAEWIRWNKGDYCPEVLVTRIPSANNGLPPWALLTFINWHDEPRTMQAPLAAVLPTPGTNGPHAAFEFREQRALGVFPPGATVSIHVPAHGSRVLRITPCLPDRPTLIGTDLNLTQGMELTHWHADGNRVAGQRRTDWQVPLTLTVLFPDGRIESILVPTGQADFAAGKGSQECPPS